MGQSKIKSKSIEINGVNYKSQLEVFMMTSLKKHKIPFKYETNVIELIPEFVFPGECYEADRRFPKGFGRKTTRVQAITYTADFTNLNPKTKRGWIIECKGFKTDKFKIIWKLLKWWLKVELWDITLYMPRTSKQCEETINLIKQYYGTSTNRRIISTNTGTALPK